MPIINEDEDQFKNKETPVGGGTSYIGGGATTAGNMATQAPMGASSDNRSPGSGFVNIGNYLGNSDGTRMAQDVANKAGVMGGSAMNKIDSWQSGALKDPGNATGYSDTTGYGDVEGSVQGLKQYTQNMGTPSGLQAITGNQRAGGALDAALMGSGQAGNIVRNAQSDWGGINNYLGQAQNNVNFGIGQGQVQKGVDANNAEKDKYTASVNDAWAKQQADQQAQQAAALKTQQDKDAAAKAASDHVTNVVNNQNAWGAVNNAINQTQTAQAQAQKDQKKREQGKTGQGWKKLRFTNPFG
jgi:hypothetical protein